MFEGIEVVVSTDNSFFARLARLFGAKWTHTMLRYLIPFPYMMMAGKTYWVGKDGIYHIIEAGFRHGVVERPWNPPEYSAYAVYRLKDEYFETGEQRADFYEHTLDFARGNLGKFYGFARLLLIIPRFLRGAVFYLAGHQTLERAVGRAEAFYGRGERYHICSSLIDDCITYGFYQADIRDENGIPLDLCPNRPDIWVLPDDIAASPVLELRNETFLL